MFQSVSSCVFSMPVHDHVHGVHASYHAIICDNKAYVFHSQCATLEAIFLKQYKPCLITDVEHGAQAIMISPQHAC